MKWTVALLIGLGIIVLGFRVSWGGWILTPFFVLNCLVLIIVVLLQSGKAADLAGAFGGAGSQTAFGPRGAATILSQATTWCAIMFMICALALFLRGPHSVDEGSGGSVLQKVSKPAPSPAKPVAPATAPAPATSAPATQQPAPQSSTPAPQSAPAKP